MEVANTVAKAETSHKLSKAEIICLLAAEGDRAEKLYQVADITRAKYMGDDVHLRGIIEFSNYCQRNCLYCGLRAGNQHLRRYRLKPDEILQIAKQGALLGYQTVVLQSGEDPWYDAATIARVVEKIKKELNIAITLSIGEKSREDYRLFREAGADRYLLKHETANKELFKVLRPGTELERRLECLSWLKELGFQVGSGNMVGLPGQTVDDLAEDLLLLKKLDVEMAGIGPFIPHPNTPLGGSKGGTVEMTLKCLAAARLLMPLTHLPATTALGSIDQQGRQKALRAGANVVMPNITPGDYRKYYEIYPGKICVGDKPQDCRFCIEGIILSLGRKVGTGPGHSPKFLS